MGEKKDEGVSSEARRRVEEKREERLTDPISRLEHLRLLKRNPFSVDDLIRRKRRVSTRDGNAEGERANAHRRRFRQSSERNDSVLIREEAVFLQNLRA